MLQWIRNRQERAARDLVEANYLIGLHGPDALVLTRQRAAEAGITKRSRQHWERVNKLVARRLKETQLGDPSLVAQGR